MKKIVVTGGSGRSGRVAVRHLLEHGYEVLNLDVMPPSDRLTLFYQVDLSDYKTTFTAMHGSLRLSLSRYTTDEEIDRVIEVLPGIIAKLRKISPYWDQERNRPRPEKGEIPT